jgi:hypothetical protein
LVVTRVRWCSAVVGLALLLAGCNVNARVNVTLRPDGSGSLATTISFDADAVQKMGGASALARTVPLDDLRKAGWKISPWKRSTTGIESISLTHEFFDGTELAQRVVDLAGPHGILQNPSITRDRGWFGTRNGLSVVVDVRSPSVGIVNDTALAARLRATGTDPAKLEAQLAVQLRTALHVSVVLQLPDGHKRSYDAATGSVQTVKVTNGTVAWDHVVKFGIGSALALLAALFFLAAGIGARRNRRRAAQRVGRGVQPERTPLM